MFVEYQSLSMNNFGIRQLIFIKTFLIFIITIFLLTFSTSIFAQGERETESYQAGQKLFKDNCASCHKLDRKMTGPALKGSHTKYPKEWLYSWIKNSQAMVKGGDPDALKIFNEYNGSVMTSFALSNAEIDNILEYIKVESEVPLPVEGGGAGGPGIAASGNYTTIYIAIIAVLLAIVLFILSRITGTLSRLVKESIGEVVPEPIPLLKKIFSPKMMAALALAFFVWLGYAMVDNAQILGRQQGYQPDQPIKFSHKLHAGTHQIDCQYCHSGASKGKSAVIPSPNVCMNCHKAVNSGPVYGRTEIQKIYDAVGWDGNQYVEGAKTKPIEWIKIHNLPDHVFFSHAQHVNAGGLECQTCHGEVEEMEVVRQEASLGMGWCVNCHRKTSVNFVGNDYYQSYEKYHEDLKNKKIKNVSVEDIGGLECQKCHY